MAQIPDAIDRLGPAGPAMFAFVAALELRGREAQIQAVEGLIHKVRPAHLDNRDQARRIVDAWERREFARRVPREMRR